MIGVAEKKIGSNEKTLFPMLIGALKGTRTPDPLLRRQMLYPAELSAQVVFFTTKIIITHVALIIKVFLPCFNFFCV